MKRNHDVVIIIPAFNEEAAIGALIRRVREVGVKADLLVINDGSKDATARIAGEEGVMVLNMPYNVGIGAAMQTGYKLAYRMGYQIAVQCDGDGQHRPGEIRKMLSALRDNGIDMVVGSRFLKRKRYKSSPLRRVGSLILSRIISMIVKQRLTDTTSGFRAVTRRGIKSFASYYPSDYPEVESLVLLHRQGFAIKEIPVNMNRRKEGESSITGKWEPCYYMIKVLLAVIIGLFKFVPVVKDGGNGEEDKEDAANTDYYRDDKHNHSASGI